MSQTTFSNMSDPDILLSVQAYATLKMKAKEQLKLYDHAPSIQIFNDYRDQLRRTIDRCDSLCAALCDEWDKRGNV